MTPYPEWLHILSWAYLSLCFLSGVIMIVDEIRRPQQMIIMNFVWPITALYGGPFAFWGYFKSAPKMTKQHMQQMKTAIQAEFQQEMPSSTRQQREKSEGRSASREQVAVATTHCGAGCTLGDIMGEWWIFGAGLTIAGGVLGTRLLLDFLLAWGFGVVFQYFTIAPMRGLSFGKGMWQAIRADTLSIVAFQVGMSLWAVLVYFVLFPGPYLKVNEAMFWFMMQIGMMVGFITSYPVNIFLVKSGWKEKMPQYKNEMKKNMRAEHPQNQKAA
jgi:hypothetical protein